MADFITIIISTSVLMMLAEIGDKTNILLISLIGKYKNTPAVLFGSMLSIIFVTILGAITGEIISNILPIWLLPLVSGIIFLWLGYSGLKDNEDEKIVIQDENNNLNLFQIIKKSFFLVGIAEFGDKSQIFVITTSVLNDPIAVAIGAILGMLVIFLLVALIGTSLLSKIPEDKMNKIAAILFIIAGIWILINAVINII